MQITQRGAELLATSPSSITNGLLEQYPEFREFRQRKSAASEASAAEPSSREDTETPEEALDSAYESIRRALEAELLEQVQAATPEFFERLVVDLVVSMGYGGDRKDAGQAVGRSGDEGVDGIIKEDLLGLDTIYLQAKRWKGSVGRPEVQKFAGALQGKRARKGIMLTSGAISKEAERFAESIEIKIVLIDGRRLAQLMVDHNLGVSAVRTYELKNIDTDYFTED